MQNSPRSPRILVLLLLILAACSDSTNPELPPPIPPLLYLPDVKELRVTYGDQLRFEVRTTAGDPYAVEFQIPADTSATASVFEFQVREVGEFDVIATARSGNNSRTRSWTVYSDSEVVPPWGSVRVLDLDRTTREGELRLSWLTPEGEPGLPPLLRYELAHSLEPISPTLYEALPKREIDHQAGTLNYESLFVDLELGVTHYFRMRVIDALERRGILSNERSEMPASFYGVSGKILALEADYHLPSPLAGVRVGGDEQETLSDITGNFELTGLLDFRPITLEMQAPPQVPPYYPMSRVVDGTTSSPTTYLMLPQSTVTVLLPEATDWDFMLLLRTLSSRLGGSTEVAHWENYPVQVQVLEKTLGNGVDYGAAVRSGIQKWNDAVGFPVLVETSNAPSVGVITSYELPLQGGGTLGQVNLIEPAGGTLYNSVPRKLRFELVEWFENQALADRVALHELGHVLYLTHSPSTNHVLSAGVSGSSPNAVHPDEATALRALIHTPNGTRYSWYQAP